MTTDLGPLYIIVLLPLAGCVYDFLLWRIYQRTLPESLAPERPSSDAVLLAIVPLGAMLLILLALGECG